MLYCVCCVCASCTAANVCLAAFDLRRAVPRPQRQPADGQSASCMAWRGRSGGKEANADLLLAIINHELRIPSVYNYRCRSQFQHVFPLPLPPPRRQGQTEWSRAKKKQERKILKQLFACTRKRLFFRAGSRCGNGESSGSEGVFPPCKLKIIFHLVFMAIFEMFYRPVSGRETRESQVRGQLKLWKWPQNMLERKCFK